VLSVAIGWFFALLLGVRHASEPDHLAAVATLLSDHAHPHAHPQGRAAASARLGALWGLGHTLALCIVGGLLLMLRMQMSPRLADAFELAVATMLLLLGARSLRRAFRLGSAGAGSPTGHSHGHHRHVHAGPSDHLHVLSWTVARRPLLVGLVHGTAGSGALTALALASMPSLAAGLVYMLLFGTGSIAGMALLTGLAGLPLQRLAGRTRAQALLSACAGATSLVLGLVWGWPLVQRLVAGA